MPYLSDEQLFTLNRLGLIPGPGETEENFAKRADYCLVLKEHLSEELKESLDADENVPPEILDPANKNLSSLYDISPVWIPIFFSNYKLTPWHGGCAWIFQINENSPTAALIQLRHSFRDSINYLGIYNRNEFLAHELSHVGRMIFQEPRFEEMLAYQTSQSPFRRWFGPIIQSSSESLFFVFVLAFIIIFDLFLIAMNQPDAYRMALWLKLIPLGCIGWALLRLWQKHRIFQRCLSNLKNCLESRDLAHAVIYRLTDEEIEKFSKISKDEITHYAASMGEKELRWRVIAKNYFL